jgi:hypothetical protein
MTPWTSDQLVTRPLPAHHKHRINIYTYQISIPCLRFEPTSASEDTICFRPLGYRDRLFILMINMIEAYYDVGINSYLIGIKSPQIVTTLSKSPPRHVKRAATYWQQHHACGLVARSATIGEIVRTQHRNIFLHSAWISNLVSLILTN